MEETFNLLTRGMEIVCKNPIYRPAIKSPPLSGHKGEVFASSIVVEYPRRWKLPRGCKVQTPSGEFIVTATPQPDHRIRLDGKNVDAVAAALHLKR